MSDFNVKVDCGRADNTFEERSLSVCKKGTRKHFNQLLPKEILYYGKNVIPTISQNAA